MFNCMPASQDHSVSEIGFKFDKYINSSAFHLHKCLYPDKQLLGRRGKGGNPAPPSGSKKFSYIPINASLPVNHTVKIDHSSDHFLKNWNKDHPALIKPM